MQLTNQFLAKLSGHTRLNAAELGALLGLRGTIVTTRGGCDLVRRDTESDYCCLVLEGLIARVDQTDDGKRQIGAFYVPGDMPDIQALLLPQAVTALQATIDSRILRIPRSALRDLVRSYPAIGEALWRETVGDARIASEWILNIGQRQARARVAHLICEIAHRVVEARGQQFGFSLPVTQTQLGEATGISTVHVNRVLGTLANSVRLSKNRAEIFDWAELQEAGGFDATYLACGTPQRLALE